MPNADDDHYVGVSPQLWDKEKDKDGDKEDVIPT